jgi:diguanylate cyclase (GGDEF)-like protein/PAS domain S-box-containing protein
VLPQGFCAINLLDEAAAVLNFGAAPRLPREFVAAMDRTPVGIRFGSCSASVYLARQVTVADIETDALWDYRREAARRAGLRSAWSTPINAPDGRAVGTFSVYRRQPGVPSGSDHEFMARMAQIAGIAIDRRSAEDALRASEAKFRGLFEAIGDAVITTDADGRIDYMNPMAESLTGWESREAQSQRIGDVLTVVDETTRLAAESPVMRCLREGQTQALAEHTVAVSRRGHEIAIQDSTAPIRDRAGKLIGAVMAFHDISKERRLHRALHYQASHDALTGLINRREFDNRLAAAVESARADAACRHALLYLDLDQFKLVNDTCGHPAGDQLLKQITGVLQSRVRAGDTLARLGGDEFGILLQHCTLDQALHVAETIRLAVRDYRFVWQDGTLAVGVSIGIVEISGETVNVANVMSAADVACYTAKDQGRNRVRLYKPDDVPERHREMQWVSKLTRAFDDGRFELYYQPLVPIGAVRDAPEHFELLLRLRDESGSLVGPAEFIPAAERYNLMPAIDRWVFHQAFEQLLHRAGSGIRPYTIALNLSGTSLNDERFLEFLIAELTTSSLSPGAVCFEITETAAIASLGNALNFMRELKTRGCHFSLDDFGSGLSSFMYLKTLPVDYLKIDGQFVENVVRDPVDRSMVEAISHVGRAMGIHTVAERVESREVLEELGRLGVGFAQGLHIAEPRPMSRFPYLR